MRSLGIVASANTAIQFVGQSTVLGDTLNLPSELEINDLMIVMVLNNTSGPDQTGWTVGGTGTAGTLTYSWYWKYFETGDTTFTTTDSTRARLCVAFRNVDPIYPFDATPTSATGAANSGDPNPPSITTVSANTLIVTLGWLDDDSVAITAPADPFYRLVSNSIGSGSGTTTAGSIAVAIKELRDAGAEDPSAFQGTGSDDWAAVTVALRPRAYYSNMSATGGTEYTVGAYKYHKFTANGNFVVSSVGSVVNYEVLCVAGGGGGGEGSSTSWGGGGGAGGLELASSLVPTAQTYAVVVGGGGAGSTSGSVRGTNGNNSTFNSTTVGTVGGGGGGAGAGTVANRNGNSGGSGGGGAGANTYIGTGGTALVSGEGRPGGDGGIGNGGGGGGGAGSDGGDATTTDTGGTGGDGADYSVWATATSSGENGFYASGGGGGGDTTGGATSDGGGGNGAAGATNATAGTANTGGGGGGSETGNGGSGGSGIVIVRYRYA